MNLEGTAVEISHRLDLDPLAAYRSIEGKEPSPPRRSGASGAGLRKADHASERFVAAARNCVRAAGRAAFVEKEASAARRRPRTRGRLVDRRSRLLRPIADRQEQCRGRWRESARGREAPGPRQGALRAHRSSLGSRATPAAARGQSSWREGPMGPRRAQDRIRGNDLGRRADRDLRFLPRRNRSSADRRRGRRRVRAARA